MNVLVVETQPLVPLGTIAPPVRDAGLELVYWRTEEDAPPPPLSDFGGIVALGGPANPDEDERYPWLSDERELLAAAVEQRLPTLGLCLGAELLAQVLGAPTRRLPQPRIGWFELIRDESASGDLLGAHFPRQFDAFEWHSYGFGLPNGAALIAGDEEATQAFSWGDCAWGFQFHLEADAGIIGDWIAHYPDVLREHGLDAGRLTVETKRRAPAYERLAAAIAGAFAGAVMGFGRAGRLPAWHD